MNGVFTPGALRVLRHCDRARWTMMLELESVRPPMLEEGDFELVPFLIRVGLLDYARRLDAVSLSASGIAAVRGSDLILEVENSKAGGCIE